MKAATFLSAVLAAVPSAYAQAKGAPFGFAAGVTGGGNAEPVYPTSIDEFVLTHPSLLHHNMFGTRTAADQAHQAHRVPHR